MLNTGAKLGPYEIIAPLGAGGMGEVYRARDTRLDRTVAIKILNSQLVASVPLRARFEREAKIVSQLQHPNVCVLHDVGSDNGTEYLVMEFLDGETLAERLKRGPLPTGELLKIAIQIADALEKAHRAGVVHRDLKPGNVMLTKSGAKLLDFGLAKPATGATASVGTDATLSALSRALTQTSPAPSPIHSPLPSAALSQAGTLIGTVQYMSPEQVQGVEADARSDIFSFGAMLFEMATGKRAFEGKTQGSIIGGILANDPPLVSSLAPASPAPLDRVVRLCLAKDPDERFQCVHDLRLELERIADTSAAQKPAEAKTKHHWLPWAAAAVLAIATIVLAAAYMQKLRAPAPHVIALNMPLTDVDSPTLIALSHDGRYFAYMAQKDGRRVLAVRSMEMGAVQYYADLGVAALAWSPDDHYLFFGTTSKFAELDVTNGVINDVTPPLVTVRGAAWMSNGKILVGGISKGILQIDPSKADMQTLIKGGDTDYLNPVIVDSRHFLFSTGSMVTRIFHVMLSTMDGKTVRELPITSDTPADYANGYVLFSRNDSLIAQALLSDGLIGESVDIANHLATESTLFPTFTVSRGGMLVYESGTGGAEELLLLDRTGKATPLPLNGGSYNNPRFSPDGKFIAYDLFDESGNRDVWIYNLALRQAIRFSLGGRNSDPIWSPDGKEIAYTTFANGNYELVARPANGATGERVLVSSSAPVFARDWSPDGRFVVYDRFMAGYVAVSIWKVAVAAGSTPSEYITGDGFSKQVARISPDGKWIAYVSNESGQNQIYLESFPERTGKWQVSTGGGIQPRWSGDGRRIYFLSPDDKVMAADVAFTASGPQVTKINELFAVPRSLIGGGNPLDVTRDGSEFVLNARRPDTGKTWNVLLNWTSLVKK